VVEITMRGEIVRLGEFLPQDKQLLFRWINDPDVVRFNSAYRPISWAEHCAWWDSLNSTDIKRSFAIRALDDDRIIGTAQLMDIHPVHRRAEVSIRIGEQSDRQRGAGSEALRLLRRYAFDHLNLNRVFMHVWADNLRAIRAYEKAGFHREGVMAEHVFIAGEWKDAVIMAVLRQGSDRA
jgi:UDP-4-amino-4,6-dideoxy-N-acetyl-beta-L-altrosamine N-acetyltransferase